MPLTTGPPRRVLDSRTARRQLPSFREMMLIATCASRLTSGCGGWFPVPVFKVQAEAIFTTALRCGPAADAGCVDVR